MGMRQSAGIHAFMDKQLLLGIWFLQLTSQRCVSIKTPLPDCTKVVSDLPFLASHHFPSQPADSTQWKGSKCGKGSIGFVSSVAPSLSVSRRCWLPTSRSWRMDPSIDRRAPQGSHRDQWSWLKQLGTFRRLFVDMVPLVHQVVCGTSCGPTPLNARRISGMWLGSQHF